MKKFKHLALAFGLALGILAPTQAADKQPRGLKSGTGLRSVFLFNACRLAHGCKEAGAKRVRTQLVQAST